MAGEQILLIDDDVSDILAVCTILASRYSYEVTTIREGLHELAEALWRFPHVILLNARLIPAANQILISTFQETEAQTPIILLLPQEMPEPTLSAVLRDRIAARLSKPLDLDALAKTLRKVLRDRLSTGQFKIVDRAQLHRLNRRLQRKLDESEALSEVGRAVALFQDLEALLARIVELAVYLTRAEEGSLLLLDALSGELYMRVERGIGEARASGFKLKVADTLAGMTMQSGQPLRLPDEKGDQHFKIKTGYLVKSLVMVPLRVADESIGVLVIDNKVSSRVFTEDDEGFLSILADYAAIAIQNALALERSRRQAQKLKAVVEAGRQFAADLDADRLFPLVSEGLAKVVSYAVCRVFLPGEEASDRLEQKYVSLPQEGDVPKHLWNAVHASYQQACSINSAEVVSRYPLARELLEERPFLAVPMTGDAGISGVVLLERRSASPFSVDERQWVEVLVTLATLAVKKARLAGRMSN
jgi:two-component system NtrC family sensor kinase